MLLYIFMKTNHYSRNVDRLGETVC